MQNQTVLGLWIPPINYVTLDELGNLSMPQFPHVLNALNDAHLQGLLWELNEFCVKALSTVPGRGVNCPGLL